MYRLSVLRLSAVVLLLLIYSFSFCQPAVKLLDGREHRFCSSCKEVIESRPPEVLFGIQINSDGEVYFSMSDMNWFNKIFKNDSYGVTVDLVSKDRYACGKSMVDDETFTLPKGTLLAPVYRKDLLKEKEELIQGQLFVRIGKLPASLKNKQLEGNLVIVNGNYICWYTNFINIDRSAWGLLPMGLFTDSLLSQNSSTGSDTVSNQFTYTKKVHLEIPFSKASSSFDNAQLQKLYDSLAIQNYRVKKIEIRAYSSVEGPEQTNKELMRKRADALLTALKRQQPGLTNTNTLSAENWLEFFESIEGTKFSDLAELSKVKIKQKLTDPGLAKEIEPLLSRQRKVVATLYLEEKTAAAAFSDSTVLGNFRKAILEKNIPQARIIQKELVDRIADKKLPVEYLNKLEVPATKDFSELSNDREVYKYLLKATSEYEALDNFLALRKTDPANGHINYNICALRFFMWQYGSDTMIPKIMLKEINALPKQGIDSSLVKRMLINYHILRSETQLAKFDYAGKDSSLEYIYQLYSELTFNDEDIYSLAKYYTNYSHSEWAEEIISPRVDKIDVSEDLVFYYVNLLFYQPGDYDSDLFQKALLNAINLNSKRFCNFFLPNDKGGASMQLLDYEAFKTKYCETCR